MSNRRHDRVRRAVKKDQESKDAFDTVVRILNDAMKAAKEEPMTIHDLVAIAKSPRQCVSIIVGKRHNPGHRVRLFRNSGPLGELMCVNSKSECVAMFQTADIRKWLEKERLL